jgi:hypothetical protein
MTAIDDIDDMLPGTHFERVEALSRATTRLRFDPYADIDWDATETFCKRMIRVGCLIRIPSVGTRWMKWLAKVGLVQYKVYTFRKPQ